MSDSTSFELIIASAELNAFGAELATLVEPLPDDKGVTARSLVELLLAVASGKQDQVCLTLGFSEDPALRDFQSDNPELQSVHPGMIAVGCFWLGCKYSDGNYSVSFTSATRSISSLMKESESVQGTFRTLAKHAAGGRIQVVNEWHEISVL